MRHAISNNLLSTNGLIILKNKEWLEKQRVAGKIAARTLSMLEKEVQNKTTKSLIELNNMAEDLIVSSGGIPTFKNYKGFPNACCISTQKQVVHGIATDYKLQEGDVVKFDLGVTIDGCIADSAITVLFGEAKSSQHIKLIQSNKEALLKSISAIAVGKRIGVIGHTINKCIKGYGFNVIDKYGGHGIDTAPDGTGIPHAYPFISNKSSPDEGPHIQAGMTIAIEPIATIGSTNTYVDKDGWTVYCDGELAVHEEHTIFVHEDRVEIITLRD